MEKRFNERFVRILGPDGLPIGCGFAITPNLVVTCAHVVTAAVSCRVTETTKPIKEISFDLPLHEQVISARARVVSWFPVANAGTFAPIEDVAVLETEKALPLRDDLTLVDIQGSSPNVHFSVYGYPDEDPRGANAYGMIRDSIAGGWTQLDQDGTGVVIQPGFSGGPVWSSDFDGVIGIVVSYDHRENLRRSTMISVRLLAEVIPELRTRLRVERVRVRARDSEPPSLLVHLCDREPQERALRRWLQTRQSLSTPAVFVVEGPDLECHAGFVQRLAGDLLPRSLSIESGTIPMLELDWPTTSLKDGDLDSGAHVALESELESSPQFHAASPLLVSSFVLSREWRDGGRAAIKQFAQFWSRQRLEQPRDLFVCIGVRYSESTSRMAWLNRVARGARLARDAVEHIRTNYPTFLVFPTLEPVMRSVVLSWAKDSRVRQWRGLSNELIINAFERIPRQNWRGGGVPMNYLAEELTALLRTS